MYKRIYKLHNKIREDTKMNLKEIMKEGNYVSKDLQDIVNKEKEKEKDEHDKAVDYINRFFNTHPVKHLGTKHIDYVIDCPGMESYTFGYDFSIKKWTKIDDILVPTNWIEIEHLMNPHYFIMDDINVEYYEILASIICAATHGMFGVDLSNREVRHLLHSIEKLYWFKTMTGFIDKLDDDLIGFIMESQRLHTILNNYEKNNSKNISNIDLDSLFG